MKRKLILLAAVLMALCTAFAACQKEEPVTPGNDNPTGETGDDFNSDNPLVGIYDLYMAYDSITTSDGTWFDEEFFETMTGKVNKPRNGYLTITEGQNGKLNVKATLYEENGAPDKVFFTTTATENNGILTIDNCTSDYYYDNLEEMISFTFHAFANNMPELYFKSIYTVNLGADYSYLTHYECTKRN